VLAQHLERDRALAGDHLLVVVGMHEREAARGFQRQRVRLGLVEVVPCRITSTPCFRVCSTFTKGVWRGITITAGMPSREAW